VFVSTTRDKVAALRAAGLSGRAIAAALGVSPPTVSYHLRKLGIPPQQRPQYDWRAVQAYYEAGHSVRECLAHFGCSSQTWHAARLRGDLKTRPHRLDLEALIARRGDRTNLKRRLIEAGMLSASCERCGLGDWRGKPLVLELHHINGDGRDHRLGNLALLCPNCHSQTESWGGRNRRAGRVPSDAAAETA
jgi:DNA-binding transcriptional ArsR family regulator